MADPVCTARYTCTNPVVCFDPWWKRFHGRNGYHCDEHCDHGIPRGERRTCTPVATQLGLRGVSSG